tara:strand:+ start:530 stop:964 length:435 start_codon:yes stop_codon:yes gene_type:complete
MRKYRTVLLGAAFVVIPLIGVGMACGAIDGKGYRCSSIVEEPSNSGGAELFFYFKDKEVHRAYLSVTEVAARIVTEKLGAYSLTPGGMAWADVYELDKESLALSVRGNEANSFSCVLMASPLVEILAHFEPILADLNSSGGISE